MLTPLDHAHAAMEAAPDEAAPRLRFYDRLADAELFVLLEAEAEGDTVAPALFDVEGGRVAVAFDREERLAEFAGAAAFHVAMSGRALAAMLAGAGIGLGLNLDVAPSAIVLPSGAIDWLAGVLDDAPEQVALAAEEIGPPATLPGPLLEALDAKLTGLRGQARLAYLAEACWTNGGRGTVLAFIDAAPGAEAALARAVGEALRFSGLEAGQIDVAFFAAADPVAPRLARVGVRIDLPQPQARRRPGPPGSDPDRPPRLR